MAIEVFNRHEKKYLISDAMYRKITPILEEFMHVDEHSRNGDLYTICNIYYDSPNNDLIRKSIEKPVYKEKVRLRSYGVVKENDLVYLEIKKKFKGFVNKRRTKIKLKDAYQYIRTKEKPALKSYMNGQVLNEIDYIVQRYSLEPALFLSYDRMAMFGKDDRSFRVTFDTNIRTRRYDIGLDIGNYGEVLLDPKLWIMEAKAEQAVPIWFAKMLSEHKIYPTSYSKYGNEYKQMILEASKLENITNDKCIYA